MSTFLLNFFPHSGQSKSTGPVKRAGLPLLPFVKLTFAFPEFVSMISGGSIFATTNSEINKKSKIATNSFGCATDRGQFENIQNPALHRKSPSFGQRRSLTIIGIPHFSRFRNPLLFEISRAQFCVTGCPILLLIGPAITAKANM